MQTELSGLDRGSFFVCFLFVFLCFFSLLKSLADTWKTRLFSAEYWNAALIETAICFKKLSNDLKKKKIIWASLLQFCCVSLTTLLRREHYYYYYWSLLYSAIFRFRADSLRSHVILHEWLAFYSAFLNIHRSGVLTALAWLVPHETAAISARSVYTIQPCTLSLHAKPHT